MNLSLRYTWTAVLTLALVLAAACGDDDDSPPASETVPPAATTAQASPQPTEPADSEPVVGTAEITGFGPVLVDSRGHTLYTFDRDEPGSGTSACTGNCATAWPPLAAPDGDVAQSDDLPDELTVVTRDDGSRQVAYAGHPLYLYASDTKPGDTTGDGVGGIWHVATTTLAAAANTDVDAY